MRTRWVQSALIAATAGVGASMLAPMAASADVVCGQTITASQTLTHDLVCPNVGVIINASNVTLDLGGHTITGPTPAAGGGSTRGVVITPGRTGVTVRNGTIRGADVGVNVNQGANNATLTQLTLDGNGLGIATATGSSGARIISDTIVNTTQFSAIQLGGDGNRVEGNNLSNGASTGILFSGNNDVIIGNSVSNMGGGAIVMGLFPSVSGPLVNNQIVGNQVSGNARLLSASSIRVSNGSGTVVYGNTATGRQTTPGIFVVDSTGTVVYANTVGNNNEGILVRGASSQTQLRANTATGNNTGIRIESQPTGNDVTGNTANSNRGDGIQILNPSTLVTSNTANANGNWGIYAVAGVTDGGGNKAAGNGQPAQCTPNIVCT